MIDWKRMTTPAKVVMVSGLVIIAAAVVYAFTHANL